MGTHKGKDMPDDLTEDEFDLKYNYDESINSTVDEGKQPGTLETFGEDIERVLEIYKKTPRKVWTVVDGEGGMYLVSGYHHVNRMYYVITIEDGPLPSDIEEYQVEAYDEEGNVKP